MTREQSDKALAASIADPVDFQQFHLQRRLWAKQREIARSVKRYPMTAVKGCHASGKTFLASGLPLQHLDEHQHAICITTAPTLRQVKMFWQEISLARLNGRPGLRSRIPEPSTVGLQLAADRYALGASSSKGVNIQGYHGANVLLIADESPGIDMGIWDAIEGIRAGGNVRVLKLGNPVVPSGEFYDAFNKARKIHNCISISAFDTPNLQCEFTGRPLKIEELLDMEARSDPRLQYKPFPSLVTREWVVERYHAWGTSNPRYQSRVLANFPTQSQRAVFDLEWIERAKREPTESEMRDTRNKVIQIGIDVAGEGSDETATCARVNGVILRRGAWPDKDPRGPVARWLQDLRRDFPEWPIGYVVVDTVGIGYGFGLHFADMNYQVYGFKGGAKAMDKEQFTNAKAENYFRLREAYRVDYVSHYPEALDEETDAQLSSLEYEELPRGQIQIEPKKKAAARGVASPDRAEAQVLAFAKIIPREVSIQVGGAVHISAF